MFLAQGIKPKIHFGHYLLGSFIIFIFSQIGSIPLGIVSWFSKPKGSAPITSTEDVLGSLEPNLSLFLLLLMFVFAAISMYFVVKYFHKQSILSVTTSRQKVDFNRIFFSFIVWAIITIGTVLYTYQLTDTTLTLQFQPEKFGILLLIAILMIPIQTSTEEYLFRGYLMQGFAGLAKNKWFPLVMTSLIFGLLHATNPEVTQMGNFILVYYIGTAFFLGVITLMDEGMELALGFHAANNLIGALLVTTDHTVFQTYAIFKDNAAPVADFQSVILPVFIIFPILLFVFSKKYNWTNWKDKLTGKMVTPSKL